MNTIDLHVHSSCSDGTLTPTELVQRALDTGLLAFALTDHDTVSGLSEAFQAAKGTGLEVVAGIELSAEYHGKDIHIVGLDLDWQDPFFLQEINAFRNSRNIRNEEMIDKLAASGIDISHEKMLASFGDAVWTRAHFARFLLENGYVSDMQEAFRRYIGDTAPCYVPRRKVTPQQAIHLILRARGIPILAHPMQYRFSAEELEAFVREMKAEGLIGIEAIYSTHRIADESLIRRIARSLGLAISGGSDFHGSNKPDIALGKGKGNLKIPYSVLKQLREYKQRRNL